MSYGVRTWDHTGNIQLDIDRRILQIVSVVNMGTPVRNQWYSFGVPGMTPNGQWFVLCPNNPFDLQIQNGQFSILLRGTMFPETTVYVFRF